MFSQNKSLLILKPTSGNPPSKIINPDTFKTLQKFEKCFKFHSELFEYESIHKAIPVLADKSDWMPLLGAPTAKTLEMMDKNKPIPRWKNAKKDRPYLTIIEPESDVFVLEIDKEFLSGFNPLKPEHGIKKYLDKNNITCDITYQLSSSQKPDSEIMCVHLFGEFDKEYPLSERKLFALSLDTDGSVYNGTNPIYIAPPQFRTTIDGKDLPDPLPNRIGFIEGDTRILNMPDIKDIDIKLKKHGRKIVKKKGGFREVSYVRKNVAEDDIKSGKNYHDAMLFLSSQMANYKKTAKEIKNELTILMEKVKNKNDRWFERMDDDHLDSICETAVEFVEANPAKRQPTSHGSIKSKANTELKELDWDIYGLIPKSRVTLIAGDGGDGKSTLCAWLASKYTNGGTWKTASDDFPIKNVAWLTAEEEQDIEVLSRFVINKGNRERFFELENKVQVGSITDYWDVQRDIDVLIERLTSSNIGVLIVDTAFSFCGEANSNDPNAMRRIMLAYNEIAVKADCTVIALVHLNKSASGSIVDDISGSKQITAVARSNLALVRCKQTNKVYLSQIKTNFSAEMTTVFDYRYEAVLHGSRNAFGLVTESNEINDLTADDVRIMNKKAQNDRSNHKEEKASEDELIFFMAKAISSINDDGISYVDLKAKTRVCCSKAGYASPGTSKMDMIKVELEEKELIQMFHPEYDKRKTLYKPCSLLFSFVKAREDLRKNK